jgi:hypothetical protein
MAEITEGRYRGEFIYSEACGTRSLETVTIDTGKLAAGTVLGRITKGAATGAAVAGNTGGSGAITASPAVGAGAKAGVYHAVCIEPATNAGKFLVTDPDGITLGVATVAVEFVGGGLTFTIADATDFVSGDAFTVTVAAGSGKYVAFNQDAVDGSEIAAAILYDNVDATAGDVKGVVYVRDCEVNGGEITWPADIEDAEKAVAVAQLATLGIIVR